MQDDNNLNSHPDAPAAGPQRRLVTESRDWRIAEYVCTAGPEDRSFEERHESFTMAAVVEGTFRYETNTGRALLHPGSWLLGNHGECFECGHDHSRGDRCLALHVEPQYFAEIASSQGDSAHFRFAAAFLPARAGDFALLARACSSANHADRLEADEAVTGIIESVIGQAAGAPPLRADVSARDEKRISAVLHYLEDHFAEALGLEDLSRRAAMSKYHFLRTFRGVVGRSPYQYLLNLRLQHAAHELMNTAGSVAHIAVSCGFGDLSTFGSLFKRQFGETPSRFRRRYAMKKNRQAPYYYQND